MENRRLFILIYLICIAVLLLPTWGAMHKDDAPIVSDQTSTADQTSPPTTLPKESETVWETVIQEEESEAQTEQEKEQPQMIQVYLADRDEVEEMTWEEYLTRVVMAEIPHTYHIEAIKAQAVAARSYCLYRMQSGDSHGESEAGICTDYAHCMAYLSETDAAERWGEENAKIIYDTIFSAVCATKDEVLTYHGNVIAALFHASSRGSTESARNVWGNEYPYLISVSSEEEAEKSSVTISLSELSSIAGKYGEADFSSTLWGEKKCVMLTKNDTGRVDKLAVGGYAISAKTLRSAISLKSTDFTVKIEGDNAIFTVYGYGHGVGMSQSGANAMAKNGCDYRKILLHYYNGTAIVKA